MYSFLKICFVLEVELMKLKLKIKDFTLKCSINFKKVSQKQVMLSVHPVSEVHI